MDTVPKDLAKLEVRGDSAGDMGTSFMHVVALVVQRGVVPLDLAVPLQVFGRWPQYLSERRAPVGNPYRVVFVSAENQPVGDWLLPSTTAPLSALSEADTVIVPGVDDPSVTVDPEIVDALRAAHERGARIVSICTGAFAIAAAGILDGRRATTHWHWASTLRERYPAVDVRESELYVEDGEVFSSAGVLAGTDLCLHLVRKDLGQTFANHMARFLVSPPHRDGGQAQFIQPLPPQGDDGMSGLMEWILLHLDEQLTLESIARHLHSSHRTLGRRFHAATGTSVMNWIVIQRVARAKTLLESTELGVEEIARRCGFGSSESLRVHFLAHTRTTPTRYRRTFAA